MSVRCRRGVGGRARVGAGGASGAKSVRGNLLAPAHSAPLSRRTISSCVGVSAALTRRPAISPFSFLISAVVWFSSCAEGGGGCAVKARSPRGDRPRAGCPTHQAQPLDGHEELRPQLVLVEGGAEDGVEEAHRGVGKWGRGVGEKRRELAAPSAKRSGCWSGGRGRARGRDVRWGRRRRGAAVGRACERGPEARVTFIESGPPSAATRAWPG